MTEGVNADGFHGNVDSLANTGISSISDGVISSSPSVVVQRVDSDIPTWNLTAADALESKESHPYLDISTEPLLADDPLKQIDVLNTPPKQMDPAKNMLRDENPMLSGAINENSSDLLLGGDISLKFGLPSMFEGTGDGLNSGLLDDNILQDGSLEMKEASYVNYGDAVTGEDHQPESVKKWRGSPRKASEAHATKLDSGSDVERRVMRKSTLQQRERGPESTKSPSKQIKGKEGPAATAVKSQVSWESGNAPPRRTLKTYSKSDRAAAKMKKKQSSSDSEEELEERTLKQIQEEMRQKVKEAKQEIKLKDTDVKKHRHGSHPGKEPGPKQSVRKRRFSESDKYHKPENQTHQSEKKQSGNEKTNDHTNEKHPGQHEKHVKQDQHDSHKSHKHEIKRQCSVPNEPILFTPDIVMKSGKGETPEINSENQIKKIDDKRKSGDRRNEEKKTSHKDGGASNVSLTHSDDENDSDLGSENDPRKIWCICKQPHDDRHTRRQLSIASIKRSTNSTIFMICCDQCSEWYHGECVGVTKRQGKEMEQAKKNYTCPPCKDKDKTMNTHAESTPDKTDNSKDEDRKPDDETDTKRKRIKIFKKPLPQQYCIGSRCGKWAKENTVYCGNECLERHVKESLRMIEKDRERTHGVQTKADGQSGNKSVDVKLKADDRIAVIERHTGRMLAGISAPTVEHLFPWLIRHGSYEILRPGIQHRYAGMSQPAKEKEAHEKKRDERKERDHQREREERENGHRKERERRKEKEHRKEMENRLEKEHRKERKHRKEQEQELSKEPPRRRKRHSKPAAPPPPPSQSDVRHNVRKTLKEQMIGRARESRGIKLRSEEIEKVVNRIEHELFKLYQDTSSKYKAKYRTLMFNLKDVNNKGLFRRVLKGDISPSKLVGMTSEQMACKELFEWREREAKHTLEMQVKQAEEESRHIQLTKKTHKGEIEIEEDSLADLEAPLEKAKPEKAQPIGVMLTDTTEQHKTHLFDLNCKICTGKMAPPSDEPSASKKPKILAALSPTAKVPPVAGSGNDSVKSEDTESSSVFDSPKPSTSMDIVEASPMPESPVEAESPPASVDCISVWKGFVVMQNLAKFATVSYKVSGPTGNLMTDLPDTLHLCGRISFEQVYDYISKIRTSATKDICIIRFQAANEEEKVSYISMYSYFSSRRRCGVVGNNTKHVKDMYLIPLAGHAKIPSALLPFDGPGLDEFRPHMLLGVIIKQKRQRHSLPGQIESRHSQKHSKRRHSEETTKVIKRRFSDDSLESKSPPLSSVITECMLMEKEEDIKRKERKLQTELYITEQQSYDPIVRQFANIDPSSLVAPVTSSLEEAPYSPSQEYAAEAEEKPYDPSDDVLGEFSSDDEEDADNNDNDIADLSPTSKEFTAPVSTVTPKIVATPKAPVSKVSVPTVMNQNSNVSAQKLLDTVLGEVKQEKEVVPLTVDSNLSEQKQKLATLAKELEQAKKALLETQIQNLQADISRTTSTLASVASQALDKPCEKNSVVDIVKDDRGAKSIAASKIESEESAKTNTKTKSDATKIDVDNAATKTESADDDPAITIPGLGFDVSSSSSSFLSPTASFLSPQGMDSGKSSPLQEPVPEPALEPPPSGLTKHAEEVTKPAVKIPKAPEELPKAPEDLRKATEDFPRHHQERRTSSEDDSLPSFRRGSRERVHVHEQYDDRPSRFGRDYDKDERRPRRDSDRDHRDHNRGWERDRHWGGDDRHWQDGYDRGQGWGRGRGRGRGRGSGGGGFRSYDRWRQNHHRR
uniref:Death-inducer obliterator 1-like n=1 Tax=Saccoglossus kowalevskii TaxID=10224 RepID=A0ABM0M0A0_SACKO|nr:PREDICTED: death-inducer obliterator 1-like [Saccoglossus kowalevskii]